MIQKIKISDDLILNEEGRKLNSCYTSLPPGCDCVCNQPCHGEGPCYSL